MADDSSSLSQDEIDQLLGMGGEESSGDAPGGGDGDLNLDSLLGGDAGAGAPGGGEATDSGLDPEALSALTDAIGEMPAPAPLGGEGGAGGVAKAAPQMSQKDNIGLLMDVTLRFTVELGRTQMYIKDVLMLGEGSIVELDKNVGDEVDILVNERLFGRGRLIVMDEYFGVQITHILDPMNRYRNL